MINQILKYHIGSSGPRVLTLSKCYLCVGNQISNTQLTKKATVWPILINLELIDPVPVYWKAYMHSSGFLKVAE